MKPGGDAEAPGWIPVLGLVPRWFHRTTCTQGTHLHPVLPEKKNRSASQHPFFLLFLSASPSESTTSLAVLSLAILLQNGFRSSLFPHRHSSTHDPRYQDIPYATGRTCRTCPPPCGQTRKSVRAGDIAPCNISARRAACIRRRMRGSFFAGSAKRAE